jgi:peptide/nickel transport system permease protein
MSTVTVARRRREVALPGPLAAAWDFLRLLSKKPLGLVGLIGVTFFLLLAYVAPIFVPLQDQVDVSLIYARPSAEHPLGGDFQGRDVLNQIVYGGRDIISTALLAAILSTLIAITFGSIAATVGGRTDAVILSITDVALTIPQLILLIVIAAIFRPTSFIALAVILALLQWSPLLRQIRAQVLSLRERDFVEAARSLDLGLGHIIFREMLPNMRSYIAIHFIIAMTHAIYAQAAIMFLGLVPLSGQNWAIMLYFAYNQGALFFKDSFVYLMAPITAIAMFQLSLVWLASGLEDVFNPRLRS